MYYLLCIISSIILKIVNNKIVNAYKYYIITKYYYTHIKYRCNCKPILMLIPNVFDEDKKYLFLLWKLNIYAFIFERTKLIN